MTGLNKELLIASFKGDLTSVLRCIFAGADVNTVFSGPDVTPLILSASRGYSSIVMTLLINGAERYRIDNEGKTAADYAFENGYYDVFQFLINHY